MQLADWLEAVQNDPRRLRARGRHLARARHADLRERDAFARSRRTHRQGDRRRRDAERLRRPRALTTMDQPPDVRHPAARDGRRRSLRPRRDRGRHRRRRPRERRRSGDGGGARHAGEDGVHHPQHLRHRLHAAAGRDRAPAAPRADGRRERRAARHRVHRHGRLQARHHHRHLGGGPRRDRARACQQQCGRGRLRAPRPHLSADRQGRRRADALRPYRGRDRPVPAQRSRAGRRHLRARQRRRHA